MLTPAHLPTGRTEHYSDGELLPKAAALQIVRSPDEPGYYLLYLDERGAEQTDTYHNSIEAARVRGKPSEWTG
jgi:hypothetical protein